MKGLQMCVFLLHALITNTSSERCLYW